jgi:hypothetical protein
MLALRSPIELVKYSIARWCPLCCGPRLMTAPESSGKVMPSSTVCGTMRSTHREYL